VKNPLARSLFVIVMAFAAALPVDAADDGQTTAHVLYDNVVHDSSFSSDWGFGCLITGPEKTILFDTGGDGTKLLANFRRMKADPEQVDLVVISHNHGDHTGGLLPLLAKHGNVAVYLPASSPPSFVKAVEDRAAKVVVVKEPVRICEHVFVLGPLGDDIIEQALVLDSCEGLVVFTGCSHPGVAQMARRAKQVFKKNVHMICGGMHLMRTADRDVKALIGELKEMGVEFAGPTHCTGDKAMALFREAFGDHFLSMGVGRRLRLPALAASKEKE
jgi:7,8-dihydropterin-6-yl-methyl-4-(beta-D-ribofuranosyl)aminobenzene 5'-phosphate synthase